MEPSCPQAAIGAYRLLAVLITSYNSVHVDPMHGAQSSLDAVVATVASVYRAKQAYESAKSQKASNVQQLASDLAIARKAERVATKALGDDVKKHGC
jgi:hypothetical protein